MTIPRLSTLLASSMHFCVDALCLCCLYLVTGDVRDYLIYNVLAFLTQPLTGIIVDKINGKYNVLFAAAGLFLGATAMAALMPDYKMVVAVMLGAGNSLFHVWGGREVAVVSGNDVRALGVFVSPGVLGLAVGAVLCSWELLFGLLVAIGILTTLHYCLANREGAVGGEVVAKKNKYAVILMVAICAVVVMRSYLAGGFSKGVEGDGGIMVVVSALVAMSGKILGGFLARIFKNYLTAFLVFAAVSVACLVAKDYVGNAVFAGLFAVNCTMPLTLYWAEKLMPGKEGLAFGLLAASLMPPYLLSFL